MDLYPAIDVRGGRCVRLVEGDFDRETVYGDDPLAVARSFAEAGARWIHMVDLDAARSGQPVNREVIEAVATAMVPHGVRVQCSGGVRSLEAASELFSAGVERVVIGTAAVEEPDLVRAAAERWPGRVAVGVDHREGEVRVRGWAEGAGRRVEELVPEMAAAGAAVVIVTDISRDGNLVGPDVDGLAELLPKAGVALIASGGVSGIDDLRRLRSLEGLAGVIAGKAIYEGRLDLHQALEVLR